MGQKDMMTQTGDDIDSHMDQKDTVTHTYSVGDIGPYMGQKDMVTQTSSGLTHTWVKRTQ